MITAYILLVHLSVWSFLLVGHTWAIGLSRERRRRGCETAPLPLLHALFVFAEALNVGLAGLSIKLVYGGA